jgi:phage shock protein A
MPGGTGGFIMPNDEYRELIEFIGRRFDDVDQRFEQVDRRFEQVDRRFEQVATKDEALALQKETRRHFDVVAERMQSQIQVVAEGVTGIAERLDRFERKTEEGYSDIRAAIHFSYV